MHSVENISHGFGSEREEVKRFQNKHFLLSAWYTLLNTYILVILKFSQTMALNLFVYGTTVGRNHLQAPKRSSLPNNEKNIFRSAASSEEICKPEFTLPKVPTTFLKFAGPLDVCIQHKSSSQFAEYEETCIKTTFSEKSFLCESLRKDFDLSSRQVDCEKYISQLSAETVQSCSEPCHKEQQLDGTCPISSADLVELISCSDKVLLLDCRTFMAFNTNHIQGALNVSCSDRITRKRLQDGKICVADVISGSEAKELYKRLESEAEIVIYDDATTELHLAPPTNSLKLLTECLKKRGKQPMFLEGGLLAFQKCFSHMCSQPDSSNGVPLLISPTNPEASCDIDSAVASKILPHLYVGNQRDASSREKLSELGITHILNVTANLPTCFESEGIIYKRLPASDSGCQNLKKYFCEAIEFIEEARNSNGRVLVHCMAGVSRSPTIVIAYLMARGQKTLMEAFSLVKDERSIIAPNLNFMGQLLEFEQCVLNKNALHPPSEPLLLLRI